MVKVDLAILVNNMSIKYIIVTEEDNTITLEKDKLQQLTEEEAVSVLTFFKPLLTTSSETLMIAFNQIAAENVDLKKRLDEYSHGNLAKSIELQEEQNQILNRLVSKL